MTIHTSLLAAARDDVPKLSQLPDIPDGRSRSRSRSKSPNMAPSQQGIFGSLKKKLSRRGSNPLTDNGTKTSSVGAKSTTSRSGHLAAPRDNSNPFTSNAPATRRPDRAGMNAFTTPSTEPPPAYTPRNLRAPSPAPSTASNADDQYAFLKSFDTIFLIDDSGSMAGRSWRETQEALQKITPICTKQDADGIDLYFLNHPDSDYYKNVKLPATIIEIFQNVRPGGGTPTGQKLNKILKPYLQQYEQNPDGTKPINIIVITDGEPSDDVESVIINAAKKLEKFDAPAWQVGIQFFQVGNEPGAREHLKQLDDELANHGNGDLRDIVDTVPFTGDNDAVLTDQGILKVVLGSVNRRLDRNSKELHRRT